MSATTPPKPKADKPAKVPRKRNGFTPTVDFEAKGAGTRKSKAVADGYAAGTRKPPKEEAHELPADATPLDVMVMAMRRAFCIGGSIMAAEYAEKAAPYMHGKISTIELKNAVKAQPGVATGPQAFRIEFVRPQPRVDDAPKDD